jgi:hypothetical protein
MGVSMSAEHTLRPLGYAKDLCVDHRLAIIIAAWWRDHRRRELRYDWVEQLYSGPAFWKK